MNQHFAFAGEFVWSLPDHKSDNFFISLHHFAPRFTCNGKSEFHVVLACIEE